MFIQLYNNKKKIFTFWEPVTKIPGYLKLCIKTWKLFLPEYDIEILNYEKVKEYLGEDLLSKIICNNISLFVQTDAIRVALLNKFGGIWMDADNIIVNGEFIRSIHKSGLTMIRDNKRKNFHHIGFISSSNNSKILKLWLEEIINKVKYCKNVFENKVFIGNNLKKIKHWDYLGNSIIDPILKNTKSKEYYPIFTDKINAFPEEIYFKNSNLKNFQKYKLFYFRRGNPKEIIKSAKGLILLHNSWTPLQYKEMSEKMFLNQDILLSKLLSQILKI